MFNNVYPLNKKGEAEPNTFSVKLNCFENCKVKIGLTQPTKSYDTFLLVSNFLSRIMRTVIFEFFIIIYDFDLFLFENIWKVLDIRILYVFKIFRFFF